MKSLILYQAINIMRAYVHFFACARAYSFIFILMLKLNVYAQVKCLSKNLNNKTNAGGALCGGRSPTPKRLQCRCGALEWRTSPHGSAPKYMRILCFWFFSLNEKNSRGRRPRSENCTRLPSACPALGRFPRII